MTVNAIHITFDDFGTAGLVTGDIIIAQSQANSVVPEPGTFAMLAAAAAGALWFRRRRARATQA